MFLGNTALSFLERGSDDLMVSFINAGEIVFVTFVLLILVAQLCGDGRL